MGNCLIKNFSFGMRAEYLALFFALLVGIVAFIWLMRRNVSILTQEDIAYLLFIFVLSYFLLNIGWQSNIKAIAHFSFILIFGIIIGLLFYRTSRNSS